MSFLEKPHSLAHIQIIHREIFHEMSDEQNIFLFLHALNIHFVQEKILK